MAFVISAIFSGDTASSIILQVSSAFPFSTAAVVIVHTVEPEPVYTPFPKSGIGIKTASSPNAFVISVVAQCPTKESAFSFLL